MLTCQSGVWARPDTPGQYAFFNASSCPAGWVAANGTNGTVDLRGEFIRGWDNGRGVDSGRALASWQSDAMQQLTGDLAMAYGTTRGGTGVFTGTTQQSGAYQSQSGWPASYWADNIHFDSSNSPGARTSTETRPRNVALLGCVKL